MHPHRVLFAIVLLAALQVVATTYGLDVPGLSACCPFLFLGCGLAIAFLLLQVPPVHLPALRKPPNRYGLPVALVVLVFTGWFVGGNVIRSSPLSVEQADMLPIIEVMGSRFLAGEWTNVYAPIPEIWNGVQPIYPPVLWGSFLPAVALRFDLRWVTLAGIVGSAILVIYPVARRSSYRLPALLLLPALLGLLAWLYTNNSHNVIRLTEEGVVYCWYCLLVYAIITGNGWVIGAATAFCLLTRYSAAGWLPAVGLYWLLRGEWAKLAKAAVAGSAVLLLLLVLPFGWKPIQVFASLPVGYIAHAHKVWDEFPQHFYHSPGMARLFGREDAATLHSTLLISSFGLPLLFVVYVFLRGRRTVVHNAPLALLVVALTVFYSFIDVPYLYLYYTPVFVSLVAAGVVIGQRTVADKNA